MGSREVLVDVQPEWIPTLVWYLVDRDGAWPRVVVGSTRGLGVLAADILPVVLRA